MYWVSRPLCILALHLSMIRSLDHYASLHCIPRCIGFLNHYASWHCISRCIWSLDLYTSRCCVP
ncbi:hypothetical protein RHMOL_Rhmol13G0146800 [Rhododendron molle]|uniref:Uncharacterized protein n=1 Tax=Rhododendron molle TaxID=49168 RepID=A0ACC0L8C2_RHOML|nr:hypothetical protein RHMOL_Rhmol13G0146800 [Rhododendron molle]